MAPDSPGPDAGTSGTRSAASQTPKAECVVYPTRDIRGRPGMGTALSVKRWGGIYGKRFGEPG